MGESQTRNIEARIARHAAVLAGVARASERLSDPQPWEALVPEALALLGKSMEVSRVYIFEVERRDGGDVVSQRFEWCAAGVSPEIDNPDLQQMPLDPNFTRWGKLLHDGQPVFGDIEDFPESERPLLEAQGIKSLIVQPIFVNKMLWGFMGFDACVSTKCWDRIEVDTLRIASLLLGAAIHRETHERLLRQSQKLEALGRMAGSIAHDLNNFLTVAAGAKQLLEDEMGQRGMRTPATDAYCCMLGQAIERADALTDRLLTFSKRQPTAATTVAPLDFIRSEESFLRQAVRQRAQLMVLAGSNGVAIAPVVIDPTELSQVLLNLAINARDAIVEHGTIVIEVSSLDALENPACSDQIPDGIWTLVRVTDTGSGMAPDVLANAFEPFFTTKSREHGTGLGLTTVKGIVQRAGGHVRAASALGKGTDFRIYLPAAPMHSGERN
jgi:signal transduction histidine kinase